MPGMEEGAASTATQDCCRSSAPARETGGSRVAEM